MQRTMKMKYQNKRTGEVIDVTCDVNKEVWKRLEKKEVPNSSNKQSKKGKAQ
jgi:succinate dehydrogenase/fumarate reductase flavoprotein subunit